MWTSDIIKVMSNNKPQHKRTVEGCYKLTLTDLGKGLLTGKTGKFEMRRGLHHKRKFAFRSIPYEPFRVNIAYEFSDRIHKQTIYLDTEIITFGIRPYLLCGCGHRANTLYLRPDYPLYFACKNCLNLCYELTQINRKVLGGELFYRNNRILKIEETKEKINKIYWRGRITKGTARLAKMYSKWCYDEGGSEKIQGQLDKLKERSRERELKQSF